jgi:protocatechuate 3,4-dioxygenase beta subunit
VPSTRSPPAGGGHVEPTDQLTFLRGVQTSDRHGVVEFRTLFPGWYVGRAIHIHAKVHLGGKAKGGKYAGGHVVHTGAPKHGLLAAIVVGVDPDATP